MKTKIIFLIVFAFVLTTGLECFGQENLTLRDEDLPYEISDSPDFTQSSQPNEYPADNVSSQSSESSTELPNVYDEDQNSIVYNGKVYYVDTQNERVYTYDTVVVNVPNAIFIYYGDGYNFTYYPYAYPVLYSTWYSWRLFRYSSWGSFCHAHSFFHRRINTYCTTINNYEGRNYGYRLTPRGYGYGNSNNNSHYGNTRDGNGGNNGHYSNTRYGNGGNNNHYYRNNNYGNGSNNSRTQSQPSRTYTQQRTQSQPRVQSQPSRTYTQQRTQSQPRVQSQPSRTYTQQRTQSQPRVQTQRPSSNSGGYHYQKK